MIADLDETIRQLLVDGLSINNGDIDIKFHQPKREWSSRLTKPTINFFMYDVRENVVLRRHQWEQQPTNGNGRRPNNQIARRKRTPYRIDCHYMMTVWATEPEDEHRLLSNCLETLFTYPTIPQTRLVGSLQSQPYEIQARLANHDKLTNPAEIWGALDNEMRPSISYVLTLAVDPWRSVDTAVTQTFTIRTGQSADPRSETFDPGGFSREVHNIRGTVINTAEPNTPQEGIRVSIKGSSQSTHTNEQGEFQFIGLLAGDYTLLVWPEDSQPQEQMISVPITEREKFYDVEI